MVIPWQRVRNFPDPKWIVFGLAVLTMMYSALMGLPAAHAGSLLKKPESKMHTEPEPSSTVKQDIPSTDVLEPSASEESSIPMSTKPEQIRTELTIVKKRDYNPCCMMPCVNHGICVGMVEPVNWYHCDCTGTGYEGINCSMRHEFLPFIFKSPNPSFQHHIFTKYGWFWSIVNSVGITRTYFLKTLYYDALSFMDSPTRFHSDHTYLNLDAYFNETYYARILPPVPDDCPTPMGVKGPKQLPDIDEVIENVFMRKKFKPEPHGTNLLFLYFAQHFGQQFNRRSNRGLEFTLSNGQVDASNIYGVNAEERWALRSQVNGKLLTQVINGEEFPPYLVDVSGFTMKQAHYMPSNKIFALGHSSIAQFPGLLAITTIWIREHNRVCDVLLAAHPNWTDEQLYETARLIIVGEILTITSREFVKHLSQYKLDMGYEPELVQQTPLQFHNRMPHEFIHIYDWNPLMTDVLEVNGKNYTIEDMHYNYDVIFNKSLDDFIHSLVNTRAGALTIRNHPRALYSTIKTILETSRHTKIQGINAYRRRLNMKPYSSFKDLTRRTDMADVLESLYGDIEAVEFYVGMLAEYPGLSVAPITMALTSSYWTLTTVMGNPISSPRYWKPSTFGGEVGMNIVRKASLRNLFCKNMKTPCHRIAFTVKQPFK